MKLPRNVSGVALQASLRRLGYDTVRQRGSHVRVPMQEVSGIEAFLRHDVLPYTADAWYQPDSVKVGYEISFTRYFYKPKPMRTLAEIRADILALEQETEGLIEEIIGLRPGVPAP